MMIWRVSQELSSSPDSGQVQARPKRGVRDASYDERGKAPGPSFREPYEVRSTYRSYPRSSDGHVHGSCSLYRYIAN